MAVKHRNRNPQGQLQPLSERLSAHQALMREERRQWRSNLARQLGLINYGLAQFFQRGIFGRFKWLVTGR